MNTNNATPDLAHHTDGLSHNDALLAAALSSDDEGSSGLSEIDMSLDTDQLDEEAMSLALNLHTETDNPPRSLATADNDSEAETERLAPSPDQESGPDDAVARSTASSPEKSTHAKSKAKSKSNVDVDHNEEEGEEEEDADLDLDGDGDDEAENENENDNENDDNEADAESKPSPKKHAHTATQNGRLTDLAPGEDADEDESNASGTPLHANSKRKRSDSPEQTHLKPIEDEPLRKRRGSLALRTDKLVAESHVRIPGSPLKIIETVPDKSPVENAEEDEDSGMHTRAKRGKRSKRRTRSTRHVSDDRRNESPSDEYTSPEQDGENGDNDLQQDPETVMKIEEEVVRRKAAALDALTNLEKQFMLMKDRVYDERIGNYQKEIDQLINHPEDHAEYQEYISMITASKTQKEDYERLLLAYRLKSLCVKSEVDRLRIHSSYYQNVRDVREKHLDDIAAMHFRLTHDRFQNREACPEYIIPFPTRRSQQIAQQAAYNKEVSILAGFAKYVGFPAAPEITPAKPHECEEDLEKIGIATKILYGPQKQKHPYPATLHAQEQAALEYQEKGRQLQQQQQPPLPPAEQQEQQQQQQQRKSVEEEGSYFSKRYPIIPKTQQYRHHIPHRRITLQAPEEKFAGKPGWTGPGSQIAQQSQQQQQQQLQGQSQDQSRDQQDEHTGQRPRVNGVGKALGQPISLPGPHLPRQQPSKQQQSQQQQQQAPVHPAQRPINNYTTPAQQRMVDLNVGDSGSTLLASSQYGSSARDNQREIQRRIAQQDLPQAYHTLSLSNHHRYQRQQQHLPDGNGSPDILQEVAALAQNKGSAEHTANGGKTPSSAASPLNVKKAGAYKASSQWQGSRSKPSSVS
ncbi:Sds3-like protein [Ascosphaera apis ARSEF 7405]|uniref:Sds3-like protein n=1 Tax=Ascosphaera apis ARSEF 7405 TaxID=392613 RepID=A0A167XA62_9EURO|nr:Sds3-like protein [Ascosphaera apis ARSEF 7405]